MRWWWTLFCGGCLFALLPTAGMAGEPDDSSSAQPALPDDYSCVACHTRQGDFWSEGIPVVNLKDLTKDVHWQRGLLCHDCHGGHAKLEEHVDHRKDDTFRAVRSPADVPDFCGRCHSNLEYMRRFDPSARTDQVAEYWTSGHGKRLKASAEKGKVDEQVATCVSCHGHHGILPVDDASSPVYPTHVADTCARCHSDPKVMGGRTYRGKPLPTDQYEKWKRSVHGRALLEQGDLSAPTCNDCHGNHGAVPPGVSSVANACGTCHGKVAGLFAETRMRHKFEEIGLPGCATCHGSHEIRRPTDQFLGLSGQAVCSKCHNPQRPEYGAPLAGADVAKELREALEKLKAQIAVADAKIQQAERLGMEVSGPRFDLRQAQDALTNARTLIHSFSAKKVREAVDAGLKVTNEVIARAEEALREHTARRIWLAASLVPIFVVIALLLLYIRTLPPPKPPSDQAAE